MSREAQCPPDLSGSQMGIDSLCCLLDKPTSAQTLLAFFSMGFYKRKMSEMLAVQNGFKEIASDVNAVDAALLSAGTHLFLDH